VVLTVAILPVAASAKTVPLSGHVIQIDTNYTENGNPRCSQKDILIIDVPDDVVSYQASVYQQNYGTFDFSGPPFTNPITGFGNPYTVPAGEAGWFLGGGSGPGSCTDNTGIYSDIQATGTLGDTVAVSLSHGTIVADGTSQTTATATVIDGDGDPVNGNAISFTSSDPGEQIGPVTDAGAGTYTATITSSHVIGQATLSATDSSQSPSASGTTTLTQSTADVSVSLVPDSINACGCSNVTSIATAKVTDTAGDAVAGDSVEFSSSNPDNVIGPVIDQGNGSYTASVQSSGDPGTDIITASDTSVAGDPSGDGELQEYCEPDEAVSTATPLRATRAGAVPRATAAASRHCTSTLVTCPERSVAGGTVDCLVTVTDTSKHPTRPTGAVEVTNTSNWRSNGWGGVIEGVNSTTNHCNLAATPGGSSSVSICIIKFMQGPGTGEMAASYPGDATHMSSDTPYITGYEVVANPDPPILKKVLNSVGVAAQTTGQGTFLVGAGASLTVAGTPAGGPVMILGGAEDAAGSLIIRVGNLLDDPPGPSYTTIATAAIPRTPDLPRGRSRLVRAIRSLITNVIAFQGVGQALHTTVDRASSAARAGDLAAFTAQTQAARKFDDRLAANVGSEATAQLKLAAVLRASHLATITVDVAKARAAQRHPAKFRRLLKSIVPNLTRPEIDAALRHLANAKITRKVNVAKELSDRNLIAGERKLATDLRKWAKNPTLPELPEPPVVVSSS
jgi:hypothetical protein